MKTDGGVEMAVAYVIGPGVGGIVKIGKADDPVKRLATIQRMSPAVLHVLAQFDGGFELETALHRHFKHLRIHGEWFDFGDLDPVAEVTAAVGHIHAAAGRKRAAAEAAVRRDARHAESSRRVREAARVVRENEHDMEQLVLEARLKGKSLRQIAKDAGMTPEGVRKMIARVEREAAAAEQPQGELGVVDIG